MGPNLKFHPAPTDSLATARLATKLDGREIVSDMCAVKVIGVYTNGDLETFLTANHGAEFFVRFQRVSPLSIGGSEREAIVAMRLPAPKYSDIWKASVNGKELIIARDPAQGGKLIFLDRMPEGLVGAGKIVRKAA